MNWLFYNYEQCWKGMNHISDTCACNLFKALEEYTFLLWDTITRNVFVIFVKKKINLTKYNNLYF